MSKTIAQLMDKYLDDALNIAQISAVQLSDGVIRKTPTDGGSAASSWTPAINEAKTNNIYVTGGNVVRQNIESVSSKLEFGDTYYLANGLPYIRWLEYMRREQNGKTIINRGQDGHMISRTKLEWSAIVKKATNAVKNGN